MLQRNEASTSGCQSNACHSGQLHQLTKASFKVQCTLLNLVPMQCPARLQDVASKLLELAAARSCSLTVLSASGALSSATLKQVRSSQVVPSSRGRSFAFAFGDWCSGYHQCWFPFSRCSALQPAPVAVVFTRSWAQQRCQQHNAIAQVLPAKRTATAPYMLRPCIAKHMYACDSRRS
jgi:hypothetical protein